MRKIQCDCGLTSGCEKCNDNFSKQWITTKVKSSCGIDKVNEETMFVNEVTVVEYKNLAMTINKIIDFLDNLK